MIGLVPKYKQGGIHMADAVEVYLPNRVWVRRTTESISIAELGYPKRCCGKDSDGNWCHVPMISVNKQNPYPHIVFRQKNNERYHIPGCIYNESRNKEIVCHCDWRAKDATSADLWKAMMNSKNERIGGGNKAPVETIDNDGTELGGVEKGVRSVEKKSILPSSPEKLAKMLSCLPIDRKYADANVYDLIVDRRTVMNYRKYGIPQDKYMLIIAKKLARENRTFDVSADEFVVVDCMYNASVRKSPHDCMQFRLKLIGKAREKMYKYLRSEGDGHSIVIFSRWEKDPNNDNTYIAKDADFDHIGETRLPSVNE